MIKKCIENGIAKLSQILYITIAVSIAVFRNKFSAFDFLVVATPKKEIHYGIKYIFFGSPVLTIFFSLFFCLIHIH